MALLIENYPHFLLNELTEDGRDALDLALDSRISLSDAKSFQETIELLIKAGH